MNQAEALAVVRSLANGVDPETGEVFPAEGPYQRPQTVRALYEAATALEQISPVPVVRHVYGKVDCIWPAVTPRTMLKAADNMAMGRKCADTSPSSKLTRIVVRRFADPDIMDTVVVLRQGRTIPVLGMHGNRQNAKDCRSNQSLIFHVCPLLAALPTYSPDASAILAAIAQDSATLR